MNPDSQIQQAMRLQSQNSDNDKKLLEDFNTLWVTFSKESRKKFHLTLDGLKKVAKNRATIDFLTQCLEKKVIPKSFQFHQNIDNRFSCEGKKKFQNVMRHAQLNNIKLAIKEHQKLSSDIFVDFKKNSNELVKDFLYEQQILIKKILEIRLDKFFFGESQNMKCKLLKLDGNRKSVSIDETRGPASIEENAMQSKKKRRRFIKRSKYRRIQKKLSRKPLDNLVINYAEKEFPLTSHQNALLQKNISFVPLPNKVNQTEINYDFLRFKRNMQFKEIFAKSDTTQSKTEIETIFPIIKHNYPRTPPSKTLSNFFYGVETDLFEGVENVRVRSNYTFEQKFAEGELITAQKDGRIVIQRADKGGAICIMNRMDYIKQIEDEHLFSSVLLLDGTRKRVYREIDGLMIGVWHDMMKKGIWTAVEEGVCPKEIAEKLLPETPSTGKAYGMPKAHKQIEEGKTIPPMRLVASGCGSNTENISHFIEHQTKHIPPMLDSYIQDTPHLLRILQEKNTTSTVPEDAILVTIDVVGLYPNIPREEGMKYFEETLQDPMYKSDNTPLLIPIVFLMWLLKCVLSYNTFVFNLKHYVQEWGTAIGIKCAPTYANIFMGKLEKKLLRDWKGKPPEFWKRYIDDILCLFVGEESELLEFLKFICEYHSTIKFTAEYRTKKDIVKVKLKNGVFNIERCPLNKIRQRSIDFLDTTIWINSQGKFDTDLFVKSTDRVTYLLPSSNHPPHICQNIPYSLAYRIKRICSVPEDFTRRLKDLECQLLSRQYPKKVIKSAFDRINKVTRTDALKKVVKVKAKKLVFALTYDPRIKHVELAIKKHFEVAHRDVNFKKAFTEKPIVAYKRGRNLGDRLIRSKLYNIADYDLRTRPGFVRCNYDTLGCMMCVFSENTSEHVCKTTQRKYPIKSKIKCSDSYVIYSIQCKKCPTEYIGQTTQKVSERFRGHYNDIVNKRTNKVVAEHFNSRGHSLSDLVFTPIEKLYRMNQTLLNVRERFWIRQKKTVEFGLNKIY